MVIFIFRMATHLLVWSFYFFYLLVCDSSRLSPFKMTFISLLHKSKGTVKTVPYKVALKHKPCRVLTLPVHNHKCCVPIKRKPPSDEGGAEARGGGRENSEVSVVSPSVTSWHLPRQREARIVYHPNGIIYPEWYAWDSSRLSPFRMTVLCFSAE